MACGGSGFSPVPTRQEGGTLGPAPYLTFTPVPSSQSQSAFPILAFSETGLSLCFQKMGDNSIYKAIFDATTGAPLSFVFALLAVAFLAVKLTSVSPVQPIPNT